MDKIKVQIRSVNDLTTIPLAAMRVNGKVTIEQDEYRVNGKTFTGISSLNVAEPMYIILTDCDKDDERNFKMWIKNTIIKDEPTKKKSNKSVVKPKLFLDFDGVIADTSKAITILYNEDYKYCPNFKKVTEIRTWHFRELDLINREVLENYFNTPRFFSVLSPLPNVVEYMKELSKHYEIYICTIGEHANLIQKESWLTKYLPFKFKFIGLEHGKTKDKSSVDMSNSVFVDDNMKMLNSSNARYKICFGDYGWNETYTGNKVQNWSELFRVLKFLAEETD